MVVGGGIPLEGLDAVVEPVVLPGYHALVVQGIWQEGGFQDTGRVLANAVLDVLQAVFSLEDGVLPVQQPRQGLVLVNPALLLRLAHGGELALPGSLGGSGGIGQEQ